MKFWKCIALGVALWSISLIWPDINRVLSEPLMARLLLGLALAALAYLLEQHFNHPQNGSESHRPGHRQQKQNGRSQMTSATPTH